MDLDIESGAPILGRVEGTKPNEAKFERMAALGAEAATELASPEGQRLVTRLSEAMVDRMEILLHTPEITGEDALRQVVALQALRQVLDSLYGPVKLGQMAVARMAAHRTR